MDAAYRTVAANLISFYPDGTDLVAKFATTATKLLLLFFMTSRESNWTTKYSDNLNFATIFSTTLRWERSGGGEVGKDVHWMAFGRLLNRFVETDAHFYSHRFGALSVRRNSCGVATTCFFAPSPPPPSPSPFQLRRKSRLRTSRALVLAVAKTVATIVWTQHGNLSYRFKISMRTYMLRLY